MAEEIELEKCHFQNFRSSWPWIGSYGIQSCITHRPLSRHQISLKSEKLFFVNIRTYLLTNITDLL